MPVVGRKLVPALLIAAGAATAGAQQKACEIDESNPAQLTRAVLDIQIAQQSAKPEDAAKKLQDAIKLLGEGDLSRNPVGRAYEKGRTLVFWSIQPSMAGGMTTRGALGFLDNPTASYDLYAGIDSAFNIVEASNPDCLSQTLPWRQQKTWVDLVNKAIELNNQDKTDSAVVYANRSLLLSKHSPYGYYVLGQAAQRDGKLFDAIDSYKLAIAAAATDTAQADMRRQLLNAIGNAAADSVANGATGDVKTRLLAEAHSAFDALSKDPGTKFADAAKTGTARLAQITGDTAAIKASYADALANPGAFSYNSLMSAAVTAAKANQNSDAIKLFEAARTANPNHRDVLYNLARLYLLDSAYTQGIPLVRQLISVDPSNPDNYQLMAIAYASLQKKYQNKQKMYDSTSRALGARINKGGLRASQQKVLIDSVPKLQKLINAYGDSAKTNVDSALKYNSAMTSLPARVSFNEFTPGDGKVTLGGQVQNLGEAAKSFTMKVDFLDKTGAVVNSQTVQVGPIDPKAAKAFKVEGVGAGIVAFKYAPLT